MPYDIGAMPMMTAAQALAVYDAAQTMPDRAKAADALAFALREAIAPKHRKKAAQAAPAANPGEPAPLTAKALSAALSAVCGVISRRNTIPILGNVLLQAKAGLLTMSGTDLDHSYQTSLRDSSGNLPDFETTVNARDLAAAVKGADDPITFALDGAKLIVTIAGAAVQMATLPAKDFPVMNPAQNFAIAMARVETFRDALGYVQHAISEEETYYYLNGACLLHEVRDGEPVMTFVATDGHRLACQTAPRLDWEGLSVGGEPIKALFPREGVAWFLKHAPKMGDMTVELSPNFIRLTMDSGVYTTKLIDGSFPDFRRVIPEKPGQHVMEVSDCKGFAAAIKRVGSVSREKSRCVALDFGDPVRPEIKATCRNMEGGHRDEVIAGAKSEGSRLEIGFNAGYLQEIAAHGKAMRLETADRSSAGKITFPDRPDRVAVLMPVRV